MGSRLPLPLPAPLDGRPDPRRPRPGRDRAERPVGGPGPDVAVPQAARGRRRPVDPADRDAVLFVHGGGFQLGGGDTYAGFAGWFAEVTGADVYMPDYRLAPEDPQPAPTDDVFAAYRSVIELGHAPSRLAVVGESAGAALAVETVRSLPEMGVSSPAAMVLISPWLDLSLSGASVAAVGSRDPVLRPRMAATGRPRSRRRAARRRPADLAALRRAAEAAADADPGRHRRDPAR